MSMSVDLLWTCHKRKAPDQKAEGNNEKICGKIFFMDTGAKVRIYPKTSVNTFRLASHTRRQSLAM